MVPSALINFFAKPGVVNTFTKLNDDSTMLNVVVRDAGMDVPGRLYYASKRDGLFNEEFIEQFIDQVGAMLIWGFGVDAMRRMINHGAVNLDKAPQWVQGMAKSINGVKIKNLSLELFNDADKAPKAQAPQTLTAAKVKRYQALQQEHLQALQAKGNTGAAKALKETVAKQSAHIMDFFDGKTGGLLKKSGSLLGKYKAKEVVKVLGASFFPAAAIGIGLPLIFQSITRGRIQRQKRERHVNTLNHLNKGLLHTNDNAALATLLGDKAPETSQNAATTEPPPGGVPQFGANIVGTIMKKAQDSLIGNTLIVDGTISGGRVLMARNFYDRLENLIQESATIFFLFFAMAPIKRFFYNLFDNGTGTFSKMDLKSINNVWQQSEKSPTALLEKLTAFNNSYVADKGIQLNTKGLSKAQKSAAKAAFEKALFAEKGLEDYLLKGKKGNLLFDLAKDNGLIATHTAGKGSSKAAIWDWTSKVDTDGMYKLAQNLERATEKLSKKLPNWHNFGSTAAGTPRLSSGQKKALSALFKKSIAANGVTWMLAAGVCGACQGWIVPRFKQWVTYKLTGRYKFPGEYNDGKRQHLFSKKNADELAAQLFA